MCSRGLLAGVLKRVSDEELPRVKALVDANPDATVAVPVVLVIRKLGRSLSRPTLGRMIVRLR